jgi:hypothetical protein
MRKAVVGSLIAVALVVSATVAYIISPSPPTNPSKTTRADDSPFAATVGTVESHWKDIAEAQDSRTFVRHGVWLYRAARNAAERHKFVSWRADVCIERGCDIAEEEYLQECDYRIDLGAELLRRFLTDTGTRSQAEEQEEEAAARGIFMLLLDNPEELRAMLNNLSLSRQELAVGIEEKLAPDGPRMFTDNYAMQVVEFVLNAMDEEGMRIAMRAAESGNASVRQCALNALGRLGDRFDVAEDFILALPRER